MQIMDATFLAKEPISDPQFRIHIASIYLFVSIQVCTGESSSCIYKGLSFHQVP
jgi:hypothetical protein